MCDVGQPQHWESPYDYLVIEEISIKTAELQLASSAVITLRIRTTTKALDYQCECFELKVLVKQCP